MNPTHLNFLNTHIRNEHPTVKAHHPIWALYTTSIQPDWETVTCCFSDMDTVYVRTFEFCPYSGQPKFGTWADGSLDAAYAQKDGLLPTNMAPEANLVVTQSPYREATLYFNSLHLNVMGDID